MVKPFQVEQVSYLQGFLEPLLCECHWAFNRAAFPACVRPLSHSTSVAAALLYVTWAPEVENARQEEAVSDVGWRGRRGRQGGRSGQERAAPGLSRWLAPHPALGQ